MGNAYTKIKSVSSRSREIIKNDGVVGFAKRGTRYAYYKKFPDRKKIVYKDILFINGCALPHPARFRVDHQVEQLKASGLSADSVFYEQLTLDRLNYYRGFVFFRCPVTSTVEEFIKLAKHYNKTCFFDVDDLVIDTKYTDQIRYVKNLSAPEKALYDDGVQRMGATLKLCDYAVTTTETLRDQLAHYVKEVFINRNVASDEMVYRSIEALKGHHKDKTRIVMGYFSGSITHNEDFELILPSVIKLLEKHKNLYLKIAGILDVPPALEAYKDRILTVPFMDWRDMPAEMVQCDINLAPLTDSIFNNAKSENKWVEAAIVKVVTAASNIGAFRQVIDNGKTGVLIEDNNWFQSLDTLITDRETRARIAAAAYDVVLKQHTSIHTSGHLASIVRKKLARNIAFTIPSTDISGGVNVVLRHADILRRRGWDVTLLDDVHKSFLRKTKKEYTYRLTIPGYIVVTKFKTKIEAYFDTVVATLWTTVEDVKKFPSTANRLYFVQGYETDFYQWGAGEARLKANATYTDETNLRYITMSLWCQKWLSERFSKESKYAPNGIDLATYPVRERNFRNGKIRILIEGDSRSEYKNTDEAFRVVEKLDSAKFHVSYLSYRKEPKSWYRVDKFYNRIAPEKVGEVYADCDILIKTSLLESFSYPPLEMMATGGLTVVLPNDGNVEYLRDGENCLFYQHGNIADAVDKIHQLVTNSTLRSTLVTNGLKTAKNYQWKNVEDRIAKLYE